MEKLTKLIEEKTVTNKEEIKSSIVNMIGDENAFILLDKEDLLNALQIDGEFLVLKLTYQDFERELEDAKIKYKISQSLSIIVSYEEDGSNFNNIEKFVNYIHKLSDKKQNSTFGIKKVDTLSEYPITIFFSGILPINQLKISIGRKLYEYIHSDETYFKPRFQKLRDDISQEIGTPILPLFPLLDTSLNDYQVKLIDTLDSRIISEFTIEKSKDYNPLEIYLLKLFYIYITLAKS